MVQFLLVALAGGVGAVIRFVVDSAVKARVSSSYPVGTMAINLTGCLLLGLLTGAALGHTVPVAWRSVLGTGLLGGFTTFSTASLDTVRLLQERRWGAGLLVGFGVLAGGTLLAGLGLAVGLRA